MTTLILCLLTAPLSAQTVDTIVPGNPLLAAATLPLGTDTTRTFNVMGGEVRPVATVIRSVTATRVEGQDAYMIVSKTVGSWGTSVHSVMVLAGSFAPVLERVQATSDSAEATFDGDRVTSWVQPNGKPPQRVDRKRSRPAFHHHAAVLPLLPLDTGYAVVIATYSMWTDEEQLVHVRVVGSEVLPHHGSPVATWKVEIDRGRWINIHWIDKATGRELQSRGLPKEIDSETDGFWEIRQ